MHDALIVGDGPSGVITAKVLLDKGLRVCMLAGGLKEEYTNIPDQPFESFTGAHHTFFESALENTTEASGHDQVTKARQHMLRFVNEALPFESSSFFPFQTLARGGLSAGWGAACFTFDNDDLTKAKLPNLTKAYEDVANIIGVSGPENSLLCSIKNKLPEAHIDHNGRAVLSKKQKAHIKAEPASLALLTQDMGDRKANNYHDMDFYHNPGGSVFRASVLLDQLIQNPNFTYIHGVMVESFKESSEGVEVSYRLIKKDVGKGDAGYATITAKKLIICGGAINSYRLVAKSLGIYGQPNPLLANPYVYIPTINWKNLGKAGDGKRHSLAQVFGEYTNNHNEKLTLQFYSYRALLLSRLMIKTPMPYKMARLFWRSLVNSLTIVGLHFPDSGKTQRDISLQKGGSLAVNFEPPPLNGLLGVAAQLMRLGCFPMGLVKTPMGGSIHYAGTIPFSEKGQHPIGLEESSSRVHGCKNVYVFDSSGWNYSPSRGLTFTIMAAAHMYAQRLCEKWGND